MEIVNLDNESYDTIDTCKKPSIYIPQACRRGYRLLICSASGLGKTNLLINLLVNNWGLQYDKRFVISPSVHYQNKYLHLKDIMERMDEEKLKLAEKHLRKPENKDLKLDDLDLNVPTAEFYESTEELLEGGFKLDSLEDGKHFLFIFDDIMLEKNQSEFINSFSRGRQKGVSCIYTTQRYYQVPKVIRSNLSHAIFFKGLGNAELLAIGRDLCPELDKKELRKMYNEAVKEKYHFFFIDRSETHPALAYRRNLDDLWIR